MLLIHITVLKQVKNDIIVIIIITTIIIIFNRITPDQKLFPPSTGYCVYLV